MRKIAVPSVRAQEAKLFGRTDWAIWGKNMCLVYESSRISDIV